MSIINRIFKARDKPNIKAVEEKPEPEAND
jgi:hypothetical protein